METKPPPPLGPRTKGLSGPSLVQLIGTGWTALAGLGLAACTLNLFARLFTNAWDPSSIDHPHMRSELRDHMTWLETHSIQLLTVGFVLNALTLVASVSLLLRRSWARVMLQILIAGQLAGLVLMTVMQVKFAISIMSGFEGPMPEPGFVKPAFTVLLVAFTIGISGGMCVMYILSMTGLRSAKAKAVFERPPGGADADLKSGA